MTVGEAYRKTKDILTEAGFEAPAFEALCLTEKVFGFNRLALITKGEETVASEEKLAVLAELTEKRLNHEPLQYLLGKWSFMGIDLLVGEGVLVPRDDTEVVTSLCIDYLSCKESPNVIDLCAGSGAISLALEKYYRRIVPLWKSKLKAGGALAFELGEGQYDEVSRILADNGFGGITESIDFGGIQRAIIGTLLQK